MVQIGHGVGRQVAAVISDMNQPLGNAVGNSLEVIEALETLKGRGLTDFVEHCLAVAVEMLLLAGAARDEADARARLNAALADGRALKKFGAWIDAQARTDHIVADYSVTPRAKIVDDDDYSILPRAQIVETIGAPRDGFIAGINAEEVGLTVVDLGGGRAKKGDAIDHAVGVVFQRKVGARVTRGEPLFTLHANDRARFNIAQARLLAAIEFSASAPPPLPLIHKVIR
jgi:pyrimidine-nucleoside phosphorylase